jgi:hypothetical protein
MRVMTDGPCRAIVVLSKDAIDVVKENDMLNKIPLWRYALPIVVIVLSLTLSSCGPSLPDAVEDRILATFDPDEMPRIQDVSEAEPLAQDLAVGAEEVLCVNIAFRCFSPMYYGRGEYTTCGDNRLVRLVDGQWTISRVVTEEEKDNFEARGCELTPAIIALP